MGDESFDLIEKRRLQRISFACETVFKAECVRYVYSRRSFSSRFAFISLPVDGLFAPTDEARKGYAPSLLLIWWNSVCCPSTGGPDADFSAEFVLEEGQGRRG